MAGKNTSYDFTRYNHHGVLRVNWMLWLVLLYMTRHTLLLAFLVFAASRGPADGGIGSLVISALFEPVYMISDLPALALVIALGARVPQAGKTVRAIWRHGKHIILDSIAVYFVLFLWKHWGEIGRFDPLLWGNILVNLAIAALVTRSRYLTDLFDEFPGPGSDDGAA
jgi:DUF2919 family protein